MLEARDEAEGANDTEAALERLVECDGEALEEVEEESVEREVTEGDAELERDDSPEAVDVPSVVPGYERIGEVDILYDALSETDAEFVRVRAKFLVFEVVLDLVRDDWADADPLPEAGLDAV